MSDCRARRIMKGFRSCGRHDHISCMMFLSLFGSEPGRHPAYRTVKPSSSPYFLSDSPHCCRASCKVSLPWYDWPMESTAIEFAYAVYDRYVKSVRTSLDAWAMTAWGFCPPKKSSVWAAGRRASISAEECPPAQDSPSHRRRARTCRRPWPHGRLCRSAVRAHRLRSPRSGPPRQHHRAGGADGVSSQILKGAQVTAMESDSAVSVIETGSSGQRTQQMLDHLATR